MFACLSIPDQFLEQILFPSLVKIVLVEKEISQNF